MLLVATALLTATVSLPSAPPAPQARELERLREAGSILTEILNVPENVPEEILAKAHCVIVIPSLTKIAFGVGGSYGRGAMVCRQGPEFTGEWGAPAMMAIEGGSFGFQLGAEATDLVLVVMNPRGATAILNGTAKLGVQATVAAGPKGRHAEAATDVTMRAEILSYSRSRGLFAGISLEGTSLRPDDGANEKVYGEKLTIHEVVQDTTRVVPDAGRALLATLKAHTPARLR